MSQEIFRDPLDMFYDGPQMTKMKQSMFRPSMSTNMEQGMFRAPIKPQSRNEMSNINPYIYK